jgi:hypothetical protein
VAQPVRLKLARGWARIRNRIRIRARIRNRIRIQSGIGQVS